MDGEEKVIPIKPEDIHYLSFEGGGGKGVAYAGPLIAFLSGKFNVYKVAEVPVLFYNNNKYEQIVLNTDQIKGISGSSAGAVTAALLACGVSLEAIASATLDFAPLKFPGMDSRIAPAKTIFGSFGNIDVGNRRGRLVPDISKWDGFSERYTDINWEEIRNNLRHQKGNQVFSSVLLTFTHLAELLEDNANSLLGKALDALPISAPDMVSNSIKMIFADWGLIHGYNLRNYVDYLIRIFNGRGYPYEDGEAYTFMDLWNERGTELVITGTNVSRGQVGYFSYQTTPNMAIADAVRISSSIPLFFKPVIITEEMVNSNKKFLKSEKDFLQGIWVDGGVINNNPMHCFDVVDATATPLERTKDYLRGGLNPNILPLVLDEFQAVDDQKKFNPRKHIPNVISFVFSEVVMSTLTENSTEWIIVNRDERDRVLFLDTKSDKNADHRLATENFEPEKSVVYKIAAQNVQKTLRRLGLDQYKDNPILEKNSVILPVNTNTLNMLGLLKAYS